MHRALNELPSRHMQIIQAPAKFAYEMLADRSLNKNISKFSFLTIWYHQFLASFSSVVSQIRKILRLSDQSIYIQALLDNPTVMANHPALCKKTNGSFFLNQYFCLLNPHFN